MSSPSITFKLIVMLLVLGCLVACTSPREKSQTLAKELLEQLSAPEEAELLYVEEFEDLAAQGVGTSFGIRVLYGSNEEYSDIASRYQELLTQQGWGEVEFGICHPSYEGVWLTVGQYLAAFEDSEAVSIISTAEASYQTLYVVSITQFPFDKTPECNAESYSCEPLR